jgi:hypothetical protein
MGRMGLRNASVLVGGKLMVTVRKDIIAPVKDLSSACPSARVWAHHARLPTIVVHRISAFLGTAAAAVNIVISSIVLNLL